MAALLHTNLPDLQLLSKGKVRDIYSLFASPDYLLFVATDRISAYDVILQNGITEKGKLLTTISKFWFSKLSHIIPNHFVTSDFDSELMPDEVKRYRDELEGRCMLVKKAEVIPLECIVRGYLTGSAWAEYKRSETVHGIRMPSGMLESQEITPPLFTPSTKAEQGMHDENISPEKAKQILMDRYGTTLGSKIYETISTIAIQLYSFAQSYTNSRSIILADTKFEFGILPSTSEVILIDEVLTPDSSRYWAQSTYAVGKSQESYDKQYLRDWLTGAGFKKGLESGPLGQEGKGWVIPQDVVIETKKKYVEAVESIMRDEL